MRFAVWLLVALSVFNLYRTAKKDDNGVYSISFPTGGIIEKIIWVLSIAVLVLGLVFWVKTSS